MSVFSRFLLPTSAALIAVAPNGAQASEAGSLQVTPSQMVQGGTGLIQTPTSRMGPEGDFSLNYTDNNEYRFWSVSMQLFDWMEATARYTDVRTRLYSQVESFSGDQTLKDKGLDVKFRLLQESYYLPELAVGFRDFGGTGFFESEYVTASKAWGPLDFHLGLGWGYLGSQDDLTNPFCKLRESFCERPTSYSGKGGKVDYNQFFKGPMAVFGGIEYQTPWEPLRLKLEYEGNNYENDRAGALTQDSRWNLGAVYRWDNFDLSLNYQRGNTVGFGISYRFNMNTFSQTKVDEPPRSLMQSKPAESVEALNRARLYQDLYTKSGFALTDTDINDQSATIYGYQMAYRNQQEATERVGRILASELPESIDTYHIVEHAGKIPALDTVIDANAFKAAARYEGLESRVEDTYTRVTPDESVIESYEPQNTAGAFYSMDFFWTQTFGSPEDFYLYQGGLIFSGGYSLNQNWTLMGSVRTTLLDNFDKFTFKVDKEDTAVPRVRTYVREYVTRSNVGLDTSFLHWVDKLDDNLFVQAYAGYLETMYGGVGGEILWRPVDSSVSFGVDMNYVRQRSYENAFGFFDYTALTGHASVYWQPQWSFLEGTQISLSAGQFLAKDKGVNIDFAKRFDSGIVVGAYAAITDVSAEEYGEGSFTKGFYLSIPFDLFVVKPAKGRGRFPWVPISRDGGQMLNRPVRLMDYTEVRSPFYD